MHLQHPPQSWVIIDHSLYLACPLAVSTKLDWAKWDNPMTSFAILHSITDSEAIYTLLDVGCYVEREIARTMGIHTPS